MKSGRYHLHNKNDQAQTRYLNFIACAFPKAKLFFPFKKSFLLRNFASSKFVLPY